MIIGIKDGMFFEFVMTLALTFTVLLFVELSRRGIYQRDVRPIPAMEAIPEAVGRAAELGRPIHYNSGLTMTSGEYAPMTMASLTIAGAVAEEAAKRGVYMRYTHTSTLLAPAIEDLLRAGYVKGGRPEMFDPQMAYLVYGGDKAQMTAIQEYIMTEKPAVSFMFGATMWESIHTMGSAALVGAMQIGGTARLYYQWCYLSMCDYCTLGEELLAASSYLGHEPVGLGNLAAMDYTKIIAMVGLIASTIIFLLGSNLWLRLEAL
jgi:hypothetical protein